ncbi:hypothetical protein [Bacillus proteolyticus]|uniref:hypothetical protein n=1 Tax=Bacillus proteolyticus TaxID=2026192 RepID=UPI0030F3DC42
MKVARTVLSGGKDGDKFKVLPIATNRKGGNEKWNTLKKQLKILEKIGLKIM